MEAEELQQLLTAAAEVAAHEVVTHARSRDVTLPHDGRTLVLITLDNGATTPVPTPSGHEGSAS